MTKSSDFKCIVSADLFRRVASCASSEPTRYYLNGVQVEPCEAGGVLLVATDGHRLICIRDPNGFVSGGTGIVSLSKAALAVCAKPPRATLRMVNKTTPHQLSVIVSDNKSAVAGVDVDDTGHEEAFSLVTAPTEVVLSFQWFGATVDGTYPDWRKVVNIQPETAKPVGSFNARYLLSVAEALCCDSKAPNFRVVASGDETAPSFIFGDESIDGFGIVMPMRGRSVSRLVKPAWLAMPQPSDQSALQAAE